LLFDLSPLGEIQQVTFLARPNRFIGIIRIDGREATCHVADTGRLKEILHEGRTVAVVKNRPGLRMEYKLVAARMEE